MASWRQQNRRRELLNMEYDMARQQLNEEWKERINKGESPDDISQSFIQRQQLLMSTFQSNVRDLHMKRRSRDIAYRTHRQQQHSNILTAHRQLTQAILYLSESLTSNPCDPAAITELAICRGYRYELGRYHYQCDAVMVTAIRTAIVAVHNHTAEGSPQAIIELFAAYSHILVTRYNTGCYTFRAGCSTQQVYLWLLSLLHHTTTTSYATQITAAISQLQPILHKTATRRRYEMYHAATTLGRVCGKFTTPTTESQLQHAWDTIVSSHTSIQCMDPVLELQLISIAPRVALYTWSSEHIWNEPLECYTVIPERAFMERQMARFFSACVALSVLPASYVPVNQRRSDSVEFMLSFSSLLVGGDDSGIGRIAPCLALEISRISLAKKKREEQEAAAAAAAVAKEKKEEEEAEAAAKKKKKREQEEEEEERRRQQEEEEEEQQQKQAAAAASAHHMLHEDELLGGGGPFPLSQQDLNSLSLPPNSSQGLLLCPLTPVHSSSSRPTTPSFVGHFTDDLIHETMRLINMFQQEFRQFQRESVSAQSAQSSEIAAMHKLLTHHIESVRAADTKQVVTQSRSVTISKPNINKSSSSNSNNNSTKKRKTEDDDHDHERDHKKSKSSSSSSSRSQK